MCATRTAAEKAASAKAYTGQKAVLCPGLCGIFRAGRLMATAHTNAVKHRRQRCLIADEERARQRRNMCVFLRHDVSLADRHEEVMMPDVAAEFEVDNRWPTLDIIGHLYQSAQGQPYPENGPDLLELDRRWVRCWPFWCRVPSLFQSD